MEGNSALYSQYTKIIKREFVPVMGCTEPAAISFAAAMAGKYLGNLPNHATVKVSGNLIKSIKNVVALSADGLKGIEAATIAGLIAGNTDPFLEVISQAISRQEAEIREYLDKKAISVEIAKPGIVFDLILTTWVGDDKVVVHIINGYTSIVHLEEDEEVLLEKPFSCEGSESDGENVLTVDGILDFVKTCDLKNVREIIRHQISYNTKTVEEGPDNGRGANVDEVILKTNDPRDVRVCVKAEAAAGSGARMNGCELLVVINSRNRSQGTTTSVPVVEYAGELHNTQEELYRAPVLSNLLGLHQKTGIGHLFTYCGAVSTGYAAGAGIAYLMCENDRVIKHATINCLAITSGVICGGVKPSYMAKIASSIDVAFLALKVARGGQESKSGDETVRRGIENTIISVSKPGKNGMRETDKETSRIMVRD